MKNKIGRFDAEIEGKQDFVVEALSKQLKLEWIREALSQSGRESRRERLLPAGMTVFLVLLLCLFRRVSYLNLLEKLVGTWWAKRHWDEAGPPCSSALTKARDRLGIEPFRILFERSSREWRAAKPGLCLHGKRVYGLDGTTLKTPDTPENLLAFGKPPAWRGHSAYPQMRLVTLVCAGTRMVCGEQHGDYRSPEVGLARKLLPQIEAGSIVVQDRNFLAYDLQWDIVKMRHADFVVRLKKNILPGLIRRLGKGDAIVEIEIPPSYRRTRKDMPHAWHLRLITYIPEGGKAEIRLLTSLCDATVFSKEELAGLYRERWEEETFIDELKTHLCECTTVNRAVVFRSKTDQRVEQELYGMLIAYNALRATMVDAAGQKTICPRRISFTSALERLREGIWDMGRMSVERLPSRYKEILTAMRRTLVPKRPDRHNARAVKIKMSAYPLKMPCCAA
jgi:hypothetical protein